jgi:formate--tetrahydrofolate ligase
VVVAINRFPFDTPRELAAIEDRCEALGVPCVPHEAFLRGGEGAVELATQVVAMADSNPTPTPHFLYDLHQPVADKIRAVATRIYGADDIALSPQAQKKLAQFEALGYADLPICIAKTQSSLSDDPRARGVPTGWTLHVTDIALSAGAGFLVVICGNMMLMPGLGKEPAAVHMDVDDDGTITGLF